MPEWLQISTFTLFVLSFLALIFTPKYIDVRLVGIINDKEFPIAEAKVEIETKDRVITMISNSEGRFSVPLGMINPASKYTFVLYPDTRTKRQLDIDVGGHKAYSSWNKLTYSQENDKYNFSFFPLPNLFTSAYAQDDINEFRNVDKIDDVVIAAIAEFTGTSVDDINLRASLVDDLELGNYELSYVNFKLKENFNIDAWKGIWESAKTPEDIISISRAAHYQDKPWGEHLISRNKNIARLMTEAKSVYPEEVYNSFLTARALRKAGDIKKSIEVLDSVLVSNPGFYLARYNEALAYSALENKEEAVRAFDQAARLQTEHGFKDAGLFNSYGRFLYKQGDYEGSLKLYERVKIIDPDRDYIDQYIEDSLGKLGCTAIDDCITDQQSRDQ